MKDAKFKHKKSGGEYTVVARVKTSFIRPALDMELVGIRDTDHGAIAVLLPNLGLAHTAVVQGPLDTDVECVLYRGSDERKWLRSVVEFTDGRFEPLDPRAACMMPPMWHMGAMGSN